MAHRRCDYAQCTPCFREWVAFLKQRQGQASRVPGTNITVRISEQTSVNLETTDQGYRLVHSRKPGCQEVLSERDRIESECEPKPSRAAAIELLSQTADAQLNAGECQLASSTLKNMKKLMTCTPRPKKRKRKGH